MTDRKRTSLLTACVACTLLGAGCAGEDGPAGDDLSEKRSAIEIGNDDISNPTRNAVVLVGGGCTGTLVNTNVVLTASHCGFSDPTYFDGSWHRISPVTIFFGPNRAAPIATRLATYVSAPPMPTSGPWPDDIVVLLLSDYVPASIAVPRPMYIDRPAPLSSTSTILQVGYGGGRNRRYMPGSGYRDWTTPGSGYLTNAFTYTATNHGPGIGDRDTDIEAGDSGGPMLLGSVNGYVMGDLSFWDPYGIATFGPGDGVRPSIRAWLSLAAPQKPDFQVVAITTSCGPIARAAVVHVHLLNAGTRTSSTRVDLFTGLSSAPAIGATSTVFGSSGDIAPQGMYDMTFLSFAGAGAHRFDVLLDTTDAVLELDETNNAASTTLVLPSCI